MRHVARLDKPFRKGTLPRSNQGKTANSNCKMDAFYGTALHPATDVTSCVRSNNRPDIKQTPASATGTDGKKNAGPLTRQQRVDGTVRSGARQPLREITSKAPRASLLPHLGALTIPGAPIHVVCEWSAKPWESSGVSRPMKHISHHSVSNFGRSLQPGPRADYPRIPTRSPLQQKRQA